jgi:hypothetical protein
MSASFTHANMRTAFDLGTLNTRVGACKKSTCAVGICSDRMEHASACNKRRRMHLCCIQFTSLRETYISYPTADELLYAGAIIRLHSAAIVPTTLPVQVLVIRAPLLSEGAIVAKKSKKSKKATAKKKIVRREYTKADVKELRAHSKARTPVATIAKLTKRTEASLRQKAQKLGIRLGHQR